MPKSWPPASDVALSLPVIFDSTRELFTGVKCLHMKKLPRSSLYESHSFGDTVLLINQGTRFLAFAHVKDKYAPRVPVAAVNSLLEKFLLNHSEGLISSSSTR